MSHVTEQQLSKRARDLHRRLCNRFPNKRFELQPVLTSWGGDEWTASYYVVNVSGSGPHKHHSFGGYRPERAFQNTLLELTAQSGGREGRTEYDRDIVTSLISELLREAGWRCSEVWREDEAPQNKYAIWLTHPHYQNVEIAEYGWDLMNVLEDAEYYAQYKMATDTTL